MSLLSLINHCQDRLSLPRSTVVVSSTDANVRMLLALANEEGVELSRRYPWESLLTEQTFTSTATAEQTNASLTSVDRIVNGSMFNRTEKRHVTGPLTPNEWQAQQALSTSLLTDSFRIQGGSIYVTPTPSAGDTYAFEYVTKNWCQSSGGSGQTAWAADADTGVIDETLMRQGIIWRFKRAHGFEYAQEFETYEREVAQAMMRDGGKRIFSMGRDSSLYQDKRPPYVPEGSWNL